MCGVFEYYLKSRRDNFRDDESVGILRRRDDNNNNSNNNNCITGWGEML